MLMALLVCIVIQAFAQEFAGKVTDSSGNPVAFANVVIMNKQDSAFIVGTVTDDAGSYRMKCHEPMDRLMVKATYIGYMPFVALGKDLISGHIVLIDAATQLDEVVVKATRPTFKMDGGALTAKIANTTLSRLGDASDVLAQLPFISGSDGQFAVFGRGAPVIYINNNRVRNQEELSKLKSDQIKEVKVIMTPGAEYDATTGAVIKITTFRPVGEGLSGMIQGVARQRRHFAHTEAARLNYRTGGLDVFAYGYNTASETEQHQRTMMQFPFRGEAYEVSNDGRINYEPKSWEAEGGFNYTVNPKHSLGMKYTFDKDVNTPFRSNFAMDATKNADRAFQGATNQEVWQKGRRQYLNLYYQGELTEKMLLHVDGDYLNGRKYDNKTTLVTDDIDPDQNDDVHSSNETNYELYAGKLWVKSSLWKGEFLLGVEGSHTTNRQRFDMLSEGMEEDIPSTNNKSEQTAFAPFVTYAKAWGRFTANLGLRYEYVNFDYYLNAKKQAEQSKVYNNLFPTFSLAYSTDNIATSVSYRNRVTRPSYDQLRSSISYNDPFTYEGGNPALLPSNEHLFNFLISYKDLQFSADYKMVKDYVFFTLIAYEDKPVNLFTTINQDVNRYTLYASYAPTISFWKPNFSVGLQGQQLTYQERNYNKPMFTYAWRNMFQFAHGFLAVLNLEGSSYGNVELSAAEPAFRMDVSVRKEFSKGRLRLTLGAQDLLNTQRERWSMLIGDTHLNKWNNTDARNVYVNVVYRFNSAKSQYKGDSAADGELNRLQ